MNCITDLTLIANNAEVNDIENRAFRTYIKSHNKQQIIDTAVQKLNTEISQQIDCTTCGNCCNSLMINVTDAECKVVSSKLNMDANAFNKKYIETSTEGAMVINTIPCHFLHEKKCSIYEQRFDDCRAFPHLHKPDFYTRVGGTLMYYGICPIIYNVIEQLKVVLGFKLSDCANTNDPL